MAFVIFSVISKCYHVEKEQDDENSVHYAMFGEKCKDWRYGSGHSDEIIAPKHHHRCQLFNDVIHRDYVIF